MIKINLLGDDTAVDHSGKLFVVGYVLVFICFIAGCFYLQQSESAVVAELTEETDLLNKQLSKLQETTKEVRELDSKRQGLNDKLAVIGKLKKNKIGPVRVLDDLNIAIPERAWLTEVRENTGSFRLNGYALDNQTIATFMKDLDASDYFDNVELVETKMADREGIKIKAFTMEARVSYSGRTKAETAAQGSGAPS